MLIPARIPTDYLINTPLGVLSPNTPSDNFAKTTQ